MIAYGSWYHTVNFAEVLVNFTKIFVGLIILIDPIVVMPFIASICSRMEPHESKKLVIRVTLGSTLLLLLFVFSGAWVLQFFQVTINDLRISGGLLLLVIALRLLSEGRLSSEKDEEGTTAVTHLVSPMLIGPGAITAAVVFAGIYGVYLTALASIAAMIFCLILFLVARVGSGILSHSVADLVSRILALFVAAIAISYIRIGITELLKH